MVDSPIEEPISHGESSTAAGAMRVWVDTTLTLGTRERELDGLKVGHAVVEDMAGVASREHWHIPDKTIKG